MLYKISLSFTAVLVIVLLDCQAVGQYTAESRFRGSHNGHLRPSDDAGIRFGRRKETLRAGPYRLHDPPEERETDRRKGPREGRLPHRFTPPDEHFEPHRRFLARRRPAEVPKFSYMPRYPPRARRSADDIERKMSDEVGENVNFLRSQMSTQKNNNSPDDNTPPQNNNQLPESFRENNTPSLYEKHSVSDLFEQNKPTLLGGNTQSSASDNNLGKSERPSKSEKGEAQLLSAHNEAGDLKASHHDTLNWFDHKSDAPHWNEEVEKFGGGNHQQQTSDMAPSTSLGESKSSVHQKFVEDLGRKFLGSHASPSQKERNAMDEGPVRGSDIVNTNPIGPHTKDSPMNRMVEKFGELHTSEDHVRSSSVGNSIKNEQNNRLLMGQTNSRDNNAWVNLKLHMDDSGALNIQLGPSGSVKTGKAPVITGSPPNSPGLDSHKDVSIPNQKFHGGQFEPHPKFEGSHFPKPDFGHPEEPWVGRQRNPHEEQSDHPLNERIHPDRGPRLPPAPHLPPPRIRPMGMHPPADVWEKPRFGGPEPFHEHHQGRGKLLFDSMPEDFERNSDRRDDMNDKHRTTILDSVPFSLGINIDNPLVSGCPEQKCSRTCAGDLRKLSTQTGCPTCECCPTVSCKVMCPLGYDADQSGCPICHCVSL